MFIYAALASDSKQSALMILSYSKFAIMFDTLGVEDVNNCEHVPSVEWGAGNDVVDAHNNDSFFFR